MNSAQNALTNLFDAVSGTGTGTGLLAYMFNSAGGQDCSSSGCDLSYYSASNVATASPVSEASNTFTHALACIGL